MVGWLDLDARKDQNLDAADPDAVDPDAVDPDAVDPDAVDPDAVDPDAADPDAVEEDTGGPITTLPYRYVRILDGSDQSDGEDAGADIDAVVLFKSDGTRAFADSAVSYEHGGGFTGANNPANAEGAPDAFGPNWETDASTCDLNNGYVSLGGRGGFLIVEMQAEIEAGDTLSIYEVGACEGETSGGGTATARVEALDVEVAVSSGVDATWEPVISVTEDQRNGPVISTVLTSFDLPDRFD